MNRSIDLSNNYYLCHGKVFVVPGGYMWSFCFAPNHEIEGLSMHVGRYTFASAEETLDDLFEQVKSYAARSWTDRNLTPQEYQEQLEWVRGGRE